MNTVDGMGSQQGWQGQFIKQWGLTMPHLIDLIDAAIFPSPLLIAAVMISRFAFRFAH